MPLSFVGQRASQIFTDTASMTATVSGATPGNLLVFGCAFKVSSRIPLTDNTGNWTRVLEAAGGGGITNTVLWYRVASGTAADNVDFTFAGDGQTAMAIVNEYSGIQVPVVLTGTPGITSGQNAGTVGIGHSITPDDADPSAIFTLADINDTGTFASTYPLFTIGGPYTKDGAASVEWGAGWDQVWPTAAQLGSAEVAAASPSIGTWQGDGTATQWQAAGAFGVKLAVTGPPPGAEMAADISSAATVSATLQPVGALNAAISAAATVLAALSPTRGLSAAIAGAASVSATLQRVALMAASLTASATVSATLTANPAQPSAELEASVAGSSSVVATLLLPGGLAGALPGTSSIDGTLSPTRGLSAAIVGSSTITGTISGIPNLETSVAGQATLTGTLSGQLGLAGILSGTSTATLEPPNTFKPRFSMTKDLSPLFQLEEFAFDCTLLPDIEFRAILTDFYSEAIGGTINIAGTDPYLIAEHDDIPQVREGDQIQIGDWTWTVRQVEPSNTGIVRVKLEEN